MPTPMAISKIHKKLRRYYELQGYGSCKFLETKAIKTLKGESQDEVPFAHILLIQLGMLIAPIGRGRKRSCTRVEMVDTQGRFVPLAEIERIRELFLCKMFRPEGLLSKDKEVATRERRKENSDRRTS